MSENSISERATSPVFVQQVWLTSNMSVCLLQIIKLYHSGGCCVYHGHLHHGWVRGGGGVIRQGTHVLHSNTTGPCPVYLAQNRTNHIVCVYGIILKVNYVSTERYVFMVLLCLSSTKEHTLYSTYLWYYFVC